MKNIEVELKQLIIDTLKLQGISPLDIASEAPLFDGGLGLDSIDALEIGLALKKNMTSTSILTPLKFLIISPRLKT